MYRASSDLMYGSKADKAEPEVAADSFSLSSNCFSVEIMSLTEGLGLRSERVVWTVENEG